MHLNPKFQEAVLNKNIKYSCKLNQYCYWEAFNHYAINKLACILCILLITTEMLCFLAIHGITWHMHYCNNSLRLISNFTIFWYTIATIIFQYIKRTAIISLANGGKNICC